MTRTRPRRRGPGWWPGRRPPGIRHGGWPAAALRIAGGLPRSAAKDKSIYSRPMADRDRGPGQLKFKLKSAIRGVSDLQSTHFSAPGLEGQRLEMSLNLRVNESSS
jgi:hypothetical protein